MTVEYDPWLVPEIVIPCAIGLVLVAAGGVVANFGATVICFTAGATLGALVTQLVLTFLEIGEKPELWWVPLIGAVVAGFLASFLLKKLVTYLLFLAVFVGGAYLKMRTFPDQYQLIIHGLDVAPPLAGLIIATILVKLRRQAIILLTSFAGTFLILRTVEQMGPEYRWSGQYLWVGVAAGFFCQELLPRMLRTHSKPKPKPKEDVRDEA